MAGNKVKRAQAESQDQPDFRDQAFLESAKILQSSTFDAEIAQDSQASSGLSLCVRSNEDSASLHRKLRWLIAVHGILGLLGIAIGGAVAFWRKHYGDETNDGWWIGLACAASLSGFFILFRGSFQERKLLKRMVSDRLGSHFIQKHGKPIVVHIEDAATRDKLKLLAEDAGLLFLRPELQRLHIEGISGRYSIASEDVQYLQPYKIGKSRAVILTVKIGETSLWISLKDQGIASELQSQLLQRNSLHRKIQRTLGRS